MKLTLLSKKTITEYRLTIWIIHSIFFFKSFYEVFFRYLTIFILFYTFLYIFSDGSFNFFQRYLLFEYFYIFSRFTCLFWSFYRIIHWIFVIALLYKLIEYLVFIFFMTFKYFVIQKYKNAVIYRFCGYMLYFFKNKNVNDWNWFWWPLGEKLFYDYFRR